jgi:hypothetical protein
MPLSQKEHSLKLKIITFVKSNELAEKHLDDVAELGKKVYTETYLYYNDGEIIKGFIIQGLPEKEQNLLMKTDKMIGTLNRPENKELSSERNNILAKVTRYYHRIGRKIFGNKLYNEDNDLADAVSREKRRRESNGQDVSSSQRRKVVNSSIDESNLGVSNNSSKEPTREQNSSLSSNIGVVSSENPTNSSRIATQSEVSTRSSSRIANQSNKEVPQQELEAPQPKRNRFAGSSNQKNKEKDMYETQPLEISVMTNRLKQFLEIIGVNNFGNLIAFEPCAGNGNISNALVEMGINNVISRDKFTLPEKHDFLVDKDPENFDFIITNPPFSVKEDILKKVLAYPPTVKVILLLPYPFMSSKLAWDCFKDKNIHIDLLSPNPKFLHDGKHRETGSCAWYYFNFPRIQTNISLSICRTTPTLQVSSSGNTQSDGKELAERCFIDEAEEVGGEFEEDEIQDYESEGEEEDDDYEDYKRNKKGYCSVA